MNDTTSAPLIRQTSSIFRNWYISDAGGPRGAGTIVASNGVPENPRTLDVHVLVYVTFGEGIFATEGKVRNLVAGDVILIAPGTPHWYGPKPGGRWDEFFLTFEGPVFDAWLAAGLLSVPETRLKLTPVRYWAKRLISGVGTGNRGDKTRALKELVELQRLLSEVLEHVYSDATERQWIDQARDLIDAGVSARSSADALGVSYDTFRRRFTRLAGLPPSRYRAQRTMEAACHSLASEDSTVSSIARQLGFYDEFHFSKRFKEVMGQTPSQFRESFR